jgi:hypothetical protein
VHLDLLAADMQPEIRRPTTLGASVQARYSDHVVMADPEGNVFCLSPTH